MLLNSKGKNGNFRTKTPSRHHHNQMTESDTTCEAHTPGVLHWELSILSHPSQFTQHSLDALSRGPPHELLQIGRRQERVFLERILRQKEKRDSRENWGNLNSPGLELGKAMLTDWGGQTMVCPSWLEFAIGSIWSKRAWWQIKTT